MESYIHKLIAVELFSLIRFLFREIRRFFGEGGLKHDQYQLLVTGMHSSMLVCLHVCQIRLKLYKCSVWYTL